MPVKSASHHHTCRQSTDHHCSGCCSCECCGGSRKYHRHYRTHRRRYSMNKDEEVKDDQPIFSEDSHRLMYYPIAETTVIDTEQKMGDVQLIPIRKIIYDLGMINKIKEICKFRIKTPPPTLKITRKWAGNLGRWDPQKMWDDEVIPGVWDDIQNERPLDPITVERKVVGGDEYYEVIDGRHWARASLCAGFDFVPAFVQN